MAVRLRYAAVLTTLATLVFVACGDDDGSVAEDTSDASSSTPTEQPTAEPTVGTYPPFEPDDYRFHLVVSCFCLGAGVPIKVTVADTDVVGAVYAADDHGRSGVNKGDPADKSFWVTINDIIDAANDTEAASVEVEWPPGQDYPSSVYVDKDEKMVDEEIGYGVSNVKVG